LGGGTATRDAVVGVQQAARVGRARARAADADEAGTAQRKVQGIPTPTPLQKDVARTSHRISFLLASVPGLARRRRLWPFPKKNSRFFITSYLSSC